MGTRVGCRFHGRERSVENLGNSIRVSSKRLDAIHSKSATADELGGFVRFFSYQQSREAQFLSSKYTSNNEGRV